MKNNYIEIFDRHRGPHGIHLTRQVMEKGKPIEQSGYLPGPYTHEEAHEEARLLVGDTRDNVIDAYVYSLTEGQYIGANYKRGETYPTWEEMNNGRMDVVDRPAEGTLLQGRQEPLPKVDAPVDQGVHTPADSPAGVPDVPAEAAAKPRPKRADKLPGDRFPVVRGRQLELSTPEGWPKAAGPQAVLSWFDLEPGRKATPAEITAALGAQLKDLGVEFPAALISRLKQKGLLKEEVA